MKLGPIRRAAKQREERPRGRILYSLVAVLSILGLAPLASVAWILIDANRAALATSQHELQLLLATSIRAEVDTHVAGIQQRTAEIAERVGRDLRARGRVRPEELARLQDTAADAFVVYLRYDDARGASVSSLPEARLPEQLDAVVLEALDRARGVGVPFLSDPVISRGPGYDAFVVASAPVQSGRGAVGAVATVAHFSSIWEQILDQRPLSHTVFAIDPGGIPFVSNDSTEVRPGMDMSESELVQRFRNNPNRTLPNIPFRWNVRGTEERYRGSYATTARNWGIFVQARESDVYTPIREMVRQTMRGAAVVLGVAILAAMVFARTLSKPIDRLAAATRSFAKGDLSKRVDVRSRNEIGELANTFNGMADELQSQFEQLKRAAFENKALFRSTIQALANAIDAKDPYTRGHSVRVNRYSVIIARYMNLGKEDIDQIHVASVLHDVGKIGINDAILQKPGSLTREEFEIMKTHTSRGAEIMSPIPQMRDIIPGLRSHHERWNGTGYPDGLSGSDIPLMGRIIAVADTFDAMTTRRPYQEPFTFEAAVARINELKRLAFDERVVEAFNRAFVAGEFGTSFEDQVDEQPTGEADATTRATA